jgi:adenylate cyclase
MTQQQNSGMTPYMGRTGWQTASVVEPPDETIASEAIVADPRQIRQQLQRILASKSFANSERMTRFLRLAVEYSLEGRSAELKEYLIGTEVFDRGAQFDPRVDPVVRVEARRLRTKLSSYYAAEAAPGELVIDLPKGTYVPGFGECPHAAAVHTNQPATLALMPFRNLSSDPENEYFSDGLTQELIHLLTRVPGLRVSAWTTSARVRELEPIEVGQQLGVGHVLTGSVRASGSRVRVSAQLIETASGHYRWSESFDRGMKDVLGLQDEMAALIARTLAHTLIVPHRTATPDPEVYQLYLKDRVQCNKRTTAGMICSVELFRQVTERAPDFAVAWAGLADAYTLMADYAVTRPLDVLPLARRVTSPPIIGTRSTTWQCWGASKKPRR